MFSIFCKRRLRVPQKDCIFVAQQFWAPGNTLLVKLLSSQKSSSSVCENDSQKSSTVSYLVNSFVFRRGGLRVLLRDRDFVATGNAVFVKSFSSSVCENDPQNSFIVSYLINSCGLSPKDAIAASKKLCFESPEKPDAVLKLLREYGFTDAHIPRLVLKWPGVLAACPNKTLLPKLEFFLSIGVPRHVLAQKLSLRPLVLNCSLKNSIIPSYNNLKNLLQSDEKIVHVFSRAPRVFGQSLRNRNLLVLRERGVPESSIVSLVMSQPVLLLIAEEKLAAHVDRAVEMGFDISKFVFVSAVRMLSNLSESTLNRKMEVYQRCGWSESDISAAWLRYPICMSLSEKKIIDNMEFLVNKMGCKPAGIAQCSALLGLSLEKRIKPRCLVARILNEKGIKNITSVVTWLNLAEKKFIKKYIIKYQKDVPELLDIYQGKLTPPKMDFVQDK